jgi:hypothetical protein
MHIPKKEQEKTRGIKVVWRGLFAVCGKAGFSGGCVRSLNIAEFGKNS